MIDGDIVQRGRDRRHLGKDSGAAVGSSLNVIYGHVMDAIVVPGGRGRPAIRENIRDLETARNMADLIVANGHVRDLACCTGATLIFRSEKDAIADL